MDLTSMLAARLGEVDPTMKVHQGRVVTGSISGKTCSVVLRGDTDDTHAIPSVTWLSSTVPREGYGCWLIQQQDDFFIFDTPASVGVPTAKLYNSSPTSITPINTYVGVTLGGTTDDTWGMKSGNTLVIPVDGAYLLAGTTSIAVGAALKATGIGVNGTNVVSGANATATNSSSNAAVAVQRLDKGDVITLLGYTSVVGNTNSGDSATYLSVTWQGN
jgi:hypothetical protein